MDVATFFAQVFRPFLEIVCAPAIWPLVVFTIFMMVRRPLLKLIPSLRRLNVKGVEMSFEERLGRIETRATAAQLEDGEPQLESQQPETPADHLLDDLERIQVSGRTAGPPRDHLRQLLIGLHPRDVIIRSWQSLEDEVYEAASLLREYEDKPLDVPYITVLQAVHLLRAKNRISQATAEVILSLMELRNDVVHDSWPVSRELANRYLHAVILVHMNTFRRLIKSLHFGMPYKNRD